MDVDDSHDSSIEIGASRHMQSVPPTAVDATDQHHRLSVWAALILVAGAAVVMTSMLGRGLDQSTTWPGPPQPSSNLLVTSSRAAGDSDRPRPDVNAPIFEQFIQLDEVVIVSENVDGPENVASALDEGTPLAAPTANAR